MSLHLHRAERSDRLVAALGDVLGRPLADPFATEIVCVPTHGVERWLSQQLSHRLGTAAGGADGVCAGVEFPSPHRLAARATAAVTGIEPGADPWQPHRAVWPLLAEIDAARTEPWAAPLWAFLGPDRSASSDAPEEDPRGGRRWSIAQHLAELYGAYASSRPAMVLDWLAGRDAGPNGTLLGADRSWQAELWRRLRRRIDLPSPAERIGPVCQRLAEEPGLSDLPERLSVFGPTRVLPDHLRLLTTLARHRDVYLWLTQPSPVLWDRIAAAAAEAAGSLVGPRAADHTVDLPRHRLLAYLGRDSRELQLTLLDELRSTEVTHVHHPAPDRDGPPTLLRLLQDDLAADRDPTGQAEERRLAGTDESIRLHACHGPDRQVEVLREVLLGLLADDPTLEPRDVIVMCPDIETFAPLISAGFGLADAAPDQAHPGHQLRVRLADRSLRQLNPLLNTLSTLFDLATSRVEAAAVLDLISTEPVARKFSFSDDDLARIADLVERSGVRWGLDAPHRAAFAMSGFGQNTWAAGLDRLLLGIAMDESGHHYLGTALPLDDIDSSDVDLVGRLTECVERIRKAVTEFGRAWPLPEWIRLAREAIQALTAVGRTDSWQLGHAYAELARIGESVEPAAAAETLLRPAEIRALFADSFRGRPSRANFRTGTLTMCTMTPMRSVPHRVVVLLGVDDGVFPRHSSIDGDDVVAAQPWIGDRDPRTEDRQLLLDAILSAEERLVVIYSGADPRTGADKPPAVPIGELLDTLDRTALPADGHASVRSMITTRHPLQPFDTRNFATDDHGRPFSFDRQGLRGARAAIGPRQQPASPYAIGELPPRPADDVIDLSDLSRFFAHPVRALLRMRAGLFLYEDDERPDDQIPIQLDGLESWSVGDRMLRLLLQGADLDQLTAAEWRRGTLPPQRFGSAALGPVVDQVRELAAGAEPYLTGPARGVDITAEAGGAVITGTLPGIRDDGPVSVSYSRLGPKHRLASWIDLLALTVTEPDRPWRAVTIGRRGCSMLGPVPAKIAGLLLGDLVDLYRTGLQGPLPLPPKASCEYARLSLAGRPIAPLLSKIGQLWAEDLDPSYEQVIGPTLEDLMAEPARPEERRGDIDEPSRFGALARRVWQPLLRGEELR
ncbi:exodeoxyribonuclease V subunit gamma [Microlunatus parietis]|uniref:RecBCD enzyme subunit RecC n=1 Tax=Microlunatus parietis TaxID=682979 RepID=A0A7Y9IEC3_9ACTN|nr:exodeoxyribonuclease V subunit gamma [Microlunatus parietis]NYE75264.1 exodeoxyribonuclease V gamma subunit [Microlunatus parietis]